MSPELIAFTGPTPFSYTDNLLVILMNFGPFSPPGLPVKQEN